MVSLEIKSSYISIQKKKEEINQCIFVLSVQQIKCIIWTYARYNFAVFFKGSEKSLFAVFQREKWLFRACTMYGTP